MGLSKSKEGKQPVQPNFSNQSGFPQVQNQYSNVQPTPFANVPVPNTTPFVNAPTTNTFSNVPPSPFQTNPFQAQTTQGFSSQTPFPSNQFPPFPTTPHSNGFPNNPFVNPTPLINSSGFPVQFHGQPVRPLVPGYAPAPGNDRRVHQEPMEQNEFSSRYFQDQHMNHLVQMPPMHSVKPRKH